MTEYAARIGRTALAATFAMAARARALRAEGKDVISLSLGEPDFPTPAPVVEAAHAAALRGETKYPPLGGIEPLRAAIAEKFTREHGLPVRAQDVLVTNGGKQGIFNIVMALIGAGDEVIIPAPAWAGYEQTVKFAGGVPVFVPCPQAQGFVLQPEALARAITGRTKLLLLNYPSNPSGATISREGLAALAEVLRHYPHVWVLSDDIYEHLLFGGAQHHTLLGVAPDLQDRVVTLSGVSKTYAMTGWRIGWCIGPAEMIRAATVVQATATSGVSSVGQAAALAALTGPQEFLAERVASYEERRDAVVAALNQIPGLSCHRPEGAFYVFPSIAGCLGKTTPAGRVIGSDDDFAMALLEEAQVAVVQGSAFALSPHIRISTATALPRLLEACQRISGFCNALR
ncbi:MULTISPECIES: pyridoxal phosphate-dependent aminotransferase [unclassified Acidocella]|uniref:pyridoxal phosphate-dependent aminotransferase n=1 Tax=unclassified Acidocella TaxID=2648610 RepID=UPI00028C78EA|nr:MULTISPECIES: pyridoxal phosphate-dependent aminotransferase [unclassified Acidocella]EKN01409.1 class I and II aminotransferase [Acidocella sp. MX-AZ02]WBO60909.1 pyridoxal phosphate-dependent aminotransferase [Acidocella sp. MX-AZ03]